MISPLAAADLDDCVKLYVQTFAASPWNETWQPEDARLRLADFLATPRASGVVLRDSPQSLVGFALGHLERSGADDHFLLQEMCVRPDQQRRGHGVALLQALQQQLPDIEHWYLLTARDSGAAGFYASQGFRPAGRLGVFVRP
ncbi:MAG: GNAT family N-acetyltransferase [Actinomycetes bacterium]